MDEASEELELELELGRAKAKAQKSKTPWTTVFKDAVVKAGAGAADTLINAPENLLNLGKAYSALSQEASPEDNFLLGRTPVLPELEMPPNRISNYLEEKGIVGTGEDYTPAQRVTDAAVQGGTLALINPAAGSTQALTNMGLGAGSAGLGRAIADITGSEEAGLITSILTPSGASRMSSLNKAKDTAKALNAIRDETRRAAREIGYVTIPPTKLASFAKNEKMLDTMLETNQLVTNNVARRALRLPETQALDDKVLDSVRKSAYETGYKPLESIGKHPMDMEYFEELDEIASKYSGSSMTFPDAVKKDVLGEIDKYRVAAFDSKDVVQKVRELRADATKNLRAADNPAANSLGLAQRALADSMENLLDRALQRSDFPPQFMDRYRDARRQIAISHTIEEAMQKGSGDVDLNKLARAFQRGDYMDGELATAAAFGNVFKAPKMEEKKDYLFSYAIPLALGTAVAQKAEMDSYLGVLAGAAAHTAGKTAKEKVQGALQKGVLSDFYQNKHAVPDYAEFGPGALNRVTPALSVLNTKEEETE